MPTYTHAHNQYANSLFVVVVFYPQFLYWVKVNNAKKKKGKIVRVYVVLRNSSLFIKGIRNFSFLQLAYEILSQTPKQYTFKESAHKYLQNDVIS